MNKGLVMFYVYHPIVELLHEIVELRQIFKILFKHFQKKINRFIFVKQSPNHKILLTIKNLHHGSKF